MPVIDRTTDQSFFIPDSDNSTANQPFGRHPTTVPRHRPRDISPDLKRSDPSYGILPVYQPMAAYQNAATLFQQFQPTHQHPPVACLPGPLPFTQPASRQKSRLPRHYHVEPDYENQSQHWESNTNRPQPEQPVPTLMNNLSLPCPWRDPPTRHNTWAPDFARDRFQWQERFDVNRRQTSHSVGDLPDDRYYNRYSQDSPRYSDEPRPSFPAFSSRETTNSLPQGVQCKTLAVCAQTISKTLAVCAQTTSDYSVYDQKFHAAPLYKN